MIKRVRFITCIILLISIISLNVYAVVVPSVNNTWDEIKNYFTDNNGDLSTVKTAILPKWYAIANDNYDEPIKRAISKELEEKRGLTNVNYPEDKIVQDINSWEPSVSHSNTKLTKITGKILGIIQVFGSVASVIALAMIGIKYMLGSVSEKAKYKETLLPYVVGCILLFGVVNIAKVLYNIAMQI